MMERYLVRYFLAVVDQGNFSRAAERCHVSQPTLSVGIARLEESLGRPLFHRSNRRVELTYAGARLLPAARRIEAEFAQAERDVADAAQSSAPVRLGIVSTLPLGWTEALAQAARQRPDLPRIEFIDGRERDLIERLARGRIDIALSLCRADQTRFAQTPLFEEPYVLALPGSHRFAERTNAVAAEELLGEPMIARRQCEMLAETSRFFTARGVRPFFASRTSDEARALALVRAGLGLTVTPSSQTAPGVALVPLADFHANRTIGLLTANGGDHVRAVGAFVAETIERCRARR